MKKLLLLFLLISVSCKGQLLPGVVSASKNYSGGSEKTYIAIPDPVTLSDTHTLVYATTGSGIQIGDTGGKLSFLVSGNYPFLQFNAIVGDLQMTSLNNTDPSVWSNIGSPSPNDYSVDGINGSGPGIELYNLNFSGSDNIIKWAGSDTLSALSPILIQNCNFTDAGFGGIIINQNVSGDGYGKFTSRFNRFNGDGSERHYLGKTGTSVQFYMDTTRIEHCYMDSSRREAVQCNNHKYVMVTNITSRHGGIAETVDQGIGQKNVWQFQGVGAGYVKNSIVEAVAPGMIASTGLDIINNRITWTQTDRPIYFQDVVANGYHYKNVGDDTVVIDGNDFECAGYSLTYVFRLQEQDCVVWIKNNRFPPSATDIYECDGPCPTIIMSGNTFDSDTLPPVTYGASPDEAYQGLEYVVTSDYDHDLGRGYRTTAP